MVRDFDPLPVVDIAGFDHLLLGGWCFGSNDPEIVAVTVVMIDEIEVHVVVVWNSRLRVDDNVRRIVTDPSNFFAILQILRRLQ